MYTDKYSSLRSYFHIKYNSHSNLDILIYDLFYEQNLYGLSA